MYNDIIKDIAKLEIVELIFSNIKTCEKGMTISYTIVINNDNILSDINTCKKIIAIMEIIRELFTKHNINIKYDITSAKVLEEAILEKNKGIINKFKKAEIIYSKDYYFNELIDNVNNSNTRA